MWLRSVQPDDGTVMVSSTCTRDALSADPDVVYIGTLAGDLFLEAEADIQRYRLLFSHLQAAALAPDHSH
ncbi:MAG: Scr1 family TA system antitoxin-like transcriptional regulator [Pseudonocardiaceae bacterium]